MAAILARHWWILALRGVAAIVFGLLAWFWPDITLIILVTLFGAYALVDGVFILIAAARGRSREPRWIVAVMGVAGILIGLSTLLWPDLTAVALVYLIAAWAGTMGAMAVLAAITLRRDGEDERLQIVIGVMAILFGVFIAIFPGPGALALVWLIGAFAVAYGVLLLALAVRLRDWRQLDGSPSRRDAAMATPVGTDV
jgi:uncharacterized membrane protein HdeD (DUF308 family)